MELAYPKGRSVNLHFGTFEEGSMMSHMTTVPSRLTVSGDGRDIAIAGDLDSHTAPQLEAVLTDLGTAADVKVDITEVGFVDSSGLRVVIEAHRRHEESNSRLVLRNPSDAVARVVEITGLNDHLNIES